ncbi:unnamed protein product [Cylindrotheca closterium]|uniref:Uncharacterized protein n=1 Tax=Cylindrotheca closterium TaxID=2856 RepID=A0AAD2JGT8_9STRA|nr:unnamed protein product [Cylindrotheca closterium]
MADEEFLLDCDSVSNLSSLSGLTFTNNDAFHGTNSRMWDLLSVASDYASLEEMSFEVEYVDDLLISDNKQICFFDHISGPRSVVSDDGFTFETISTDDDNDANEDSYLVSAAHNDSTCFEVQSDSESSDDDENDTDLFSVHSKLTSLDQEEKAAMKAAKSPTSVANFGDGSRAIFSVTASSAPKANSAPANNWRLQRARERREQALKRCNDVLNNETAVPHHHSQLTTKRQDLINLVSAIEAMDGSDILATGTSQLAKQASAPASSSTLAGRRRRSLEELRSRQRESLQGLISAFHAVCDNKKAQTNTRHYNQYNNKKTSSAAPTTQQPIFTCV